MTPRHLNLITVFGLGRMRPFPGTWGSLPSVILAAILLAAGVGPGAHPFLYNGLLLLVAIVFSGACISQGSAAEARYFRKDPSNVVADEVAGQCLPLLFLPAAAVANPTSAVFVLIYASIVFRALDILKPWPANTLQEQPGGWGILLDDLAAGAYSFLIVQGVTRLAL